MQKVEGSSPFSRSPDRSSSKPGEPLAGRSGGLPTYGARRVEGLRREEVASLAGVSVEYYRRLERGNVTGVSEGVLEALARALRLDDAERTHLHDLARAVGWVGTNSPARRRSAQQRVRPGVQQIVDGMTTPAI